MKARSQLLTAICVSVSLIGGSPCALAAMGSGQTVELPAEVLRDKIRGGLLGQMLGNLNGLEHEMEYIAEPGNVEKYTPALPEGAWTDDDTDFEWVYIVEMQKAGTILLPPHRIAELWRARINKRIWCSNQYARQLMDLGLEPPLTGHIALNPWADFNISGQFLSETFGLFAPGMPQTAGRIGLNYTRVAIDGEPAQTTQMFTTMIATAFLVNDIEKIIEAGVAAVDPDSVIHQIVGDVRRWHRQHPGDWRATRRLVKERYSRHNGKMRDRNGYELNTASTIGALLYGQGDFARTLRTAFNFGWDCDNNAATAGTIVGVIKGYRWMMAQGWKIRDRYVNKTRENMPEDETITSFADRVLDLAQHVIVDQGGKRLTRGLQTVYRIHVQEPANVLPLANLHQQVEKMRSEMGSEIEHGIVKGSSDEEIARAAYMAISLDLALSIRQKHPERWLKALDALNRFPKVVQVLFYQSPIRAGDRLRERAIAAGLRRPANKERIW